MMGERQAATVVAAILQRGGTIASAGGYLRDLARKAAAGQFSTGRMPKCPTVSNRKPTFGPCAATRASHSPEAAKARQSAELGSIESITYIQQQE